MKIATTLFALLTTGVSLQVDPEAGSCGTHNFAFQAGESITYKVYYKLAGVYVGAGEAVFSSALDHLNGKPVYHVKGDGKTYSFYDNFFRVRDKYESYIDTSTLQPYKFVRDVDEGGHKTYENVTFNKLTNTALTDQGVFKVPACVQDVMSTMYYTRNVDFNNLKPGDKIPFSMFLDNRVYNLYIRYLGKETIRTKYGKFRTIKFKPLLIQGTIFSGGEKMTVWVSDDLNHIPVRVESPIVVGDIVVDMINFQNRRHPLTSLVDL
ncbi:MAG TPA: DUF3108 domain-containing protein [Puia sp.]|nr:DUF3108 domain-containing protein [Puia sp.]